MLEFGALPPEINSGLMYTGPGSAPMLSASAAWDALADDLYLTATAYSGAISDLTSSWLGPSSASMAAAAAPFVSWISDTAAHAEQTAAQARAAVAAYEAAFAMTVPPPVIAANRALLLMLVATNFLGQNAPAIAATEAHYMEMWAQDASAMYGYAGMSSAAAALTPFTAPLPTTNSTGLAAAATQVAGTSAGAGMQTLSPLSSGLSSSLTSAATPDVLASTVTSSSTSPLSSLTTLSSSSTALTSGTTLVSGTASSASMATSGVSLLGSAASLTNSFGSASAFGNGFQVFGSALSPGIGSGAGALGSPGMGGGAVTATAGRAASLGVLSVPQGWTSAAPAFSQVASALPAGGSGVAPVVPPSPSAPFGPSLGNMAERGGVSQPLAARYDIRPAVVQRPVSAG